jgi:hypothetical protein
MARWRLILLLLAASFLLAACRVDTAVVLRLNSDGSGRVILKVNIDKAAVTAGEVDGRTLETTLRVDDLSAAGWHISKWRRTSEGASITAWHSFANPQGVAPILAEIVGAESSFFKRAVVIHKPGALVDKYSVDLELDPAALKLGLANDPALSQVLRNAGVAPEIVEENLNDRAASDIRFSLKSELPGGAISSAAGKGDVKNGAASSGRIALVSSTKVWHPEAISLLLLGCALVISALLVLLAGSIRARRRPHGRHANRHGRHGAHAPAQPSDEVERHRPRSEHGKHAPHK